MSATSRNVASVFKRESNEASNLPRLEQIQDIEYSNLVAALYSKAVDIWQCERGNRTDDTFMRFWNWDPARTGAFQDPWVPWHRSNFNNKVNTSPLLVVDETLQPRIIGMHLRGRWDGEFQDFDPRQQVLVMNKMWVDEIVRMRQRVRNDDNPENAHANWFRFYLAEFRVIHMILHELGHLKVTYLGHGVVTTPGRIRAANPRQQGSREGSGSSSREARRATGESGEFFERGFYGGPVDYIVDNQPLGDRGFPWIFTGRDRAYRADIISIARLMRGELPAAEDYIIEKTETSMRAEEVEGGRPRIIGTQDGRPAGTIMSMRARSEEQIDMPPTPRLAGANLSVDQLQRLTASPVLSQA